MDFTEQLDKAKGFFDGGAAKAPRYDSVSPSVIKSTLEEIYSINSSNWYAALPYCFRLNYSLDKTAQHEQTDIAAKTFGTVYFNLPISPSNLSITTHFATNIIPTLYGTVEEHSPIRYYDIVIEGTTGMAPRYINPTINSNNMSGGVSANSSVKDKTDLFGRSSFPVAKKLPLGGFGQKTVGPNKNKINKATDLKNGATKIGDRLGGQPDTLRDPGLYDEASGYVAFHNFYRFMQIYKNRTVNRVHSKHKYSPLHFLNYKDGNRYNVVIQTFTLKRSADNPMLYNYSIVMRGYNLASISEEERLTSEDEQTALNGLGLGGIDGSSPLGDLKKMANDAKVLIGSAVGGVDALGR